MSELDRPTLLVTGASGYVGRTVVEQLLDLQTHPVIAATRSPDRLEDLAARGAIVRYADFDEPASLAEAFAGAGRMLLISTDAVGVPGKRLKQHQTAVKAAEAAGVQHVVYTSLPNPGPGSPVGLAPDHYGTEQALEASSMGWTALRNNLYAETLIGALQQALRMGGKLFSAAGDGRAAYVTRDDCARTAAAALAATFTGRRRLDVTGPQALSQADIAGIGSNVTGQTITYVPVELDALIDGMVQAGLPRPAAALYASFDTAIEQGLLSEVSDTVEQLTGQPPTPVADFLAAQPAETWQVAEE